MEHKLRLKYKDGEAVANREVVLRKGGDRVRTETDGDGRCEFTWSHDFVDALEIEQEVVRRDWDLASGFSGKKADLGELLIARGDSPDDENVDDEDDGAGVRGRLFYSDGTLSHDTLKVVVELSDGMRFSSDDRRSYSRSDGSFFVATTRGGRLVKMYIDGDTVPGNDFHRGRDGSYVVVVPNGYGRGKGSKGGLITGRIVDSDGSPAANCKITAEVQSSGWFGGAENALTYSDKSGKFSLPFVGGTVIKKLYVGGSEPKRVSRGSGENAQEISSRGISAGSFNLRVERQKKMFGIF